MGFIAVVITLFIVSGVALNVSFQIWGRRVIKYKLRVQSLDIELCERKVWSVPYETIGEVRRLTFWESVRILRTIHLMNRFFGPRILIRRLSATDLVLTPDNPDAFVNAASVATQK